MAQEPRTPWSRWDLPVGENPAAQPSFYSPPPSRVGGGSAGGGGALSPIVLPPRQFDQPNLAINPYSNHNHQPQQSFFPPPLLPSSAASPSGGGGVVDAFLVTKEPNPEDPSFYNCIYGIPNNVQQIIQECHVDVDCCERTCCDTNWWRIKFTWAIVLLSLICLVVVIALIVWLVVWLINRARDKAQRKKLLEGEGISASSYTSNAHIASPYTLGHNAPAGGTLRRY